MFIIVVFVYWFNKKEIDWVLTSWTIRCFIPVRVRYQNNLIFLVPHVHNSYIGARRISSCKTRLFHDDFAFRVPQTTPIVTRFGLIMITWWWLMNLPFTKRTGPVPFVSKAHGDGDDYVWNFFADHIRNDEIRPRTKATEIARRIDRYWVKKTKLQSSSSNS